MANTYHLPGWAVNSAAIPVTGRFLAHNHKSMVERAFEAFDLNSGVTQLVQPTMTQAAFLTRVNITYAWWAAKRIAERADIVAGRRPLVPPRASILKTNGHALTVPLVPLVPELDDSTLVNIARAVGAERMLAAAVAVEKAQ